MTYVRRAMVEDIAEILPIARAFHAESPIHAPYPFDDAKVEALIAAAVQDPAWLALVAIADEGIVGLTLMFSAEMFFGGALEAADLTFYVSPAKRGTRAAILMLEAIVSWAADQGCARVSIAPNTGINHAAAGKLFARFGFTTTAQIWTRVLD